MVDWKALRATIALDRGGWCYMCETAPWTELHHCLVHKKYGHPEYDCVENLMPVCSDCHPYANGYKIRCRFWRSQVKLYSRDRMMEWLDGLNLKVPLRFE
jgi:hypothetical protein